MKALAIRQHGTWMAIVAIAGAAHAQRANVDSFPPILQKAIRAASTLKYSGERVVELREGPDLIKNREFIWKDGDQMRIEYPAGSRSAGQIIVDKGRKRWHYFPDKHEIHVYPSRRDEVVQRLVGSFRAGKGMRPKFEVSEGGNIAGARTSRISMIGPRGEVVQALWVDDKTGAILKRELFNPAGARQGYYEFVRFNANPTFRSRDFEVRVPGAKLVEPEELALRLMKSGGFVRLFLQESADIELEGARPFAGSMGLALHYRAKNGVLSLVQVKNSVETKMFDRMKRDGQNVVVWKRGDRTFILIGSLSESELRALSQKTQER